MKRLGALLTSNAAANVTLVLTCVVVLWSWTGRQPGESGPAAREGVWPAGTPFPIALGDDKAPITRHLVLIVHSGCRYCTQEMPFYRELASIAAKVGTAQIHVASSEDESALTSYVDANNLGGVSLLPKTKVPGVAGTPTIALIDAAGRVTRSWRGVLSEKQKAILRKLL